MTDSLAKPACTCQPNWPYENDYRCPACNMTTANPERAAVVAWLRREAGLFMRCKVPLVMRLKLAWRVIMFPTGPYYAATELAARAIERGDHITEQETYNGRD